MAVRVVLPLKGPYVGPLTVVGGIDARSLGAWNVVAGSAEAFFARIDEGPLKIRWQFPGLKPQEEEIILEYDKAKTGPTRFVLKPPK